MKNKILLAVLAVALVVGMTACRSDGGETDIWSPVTNYSQLNGTWKGSGNFIVTDQGITATINIYIWTETYVVDAGTIKSMRLSCSAKETFSVTDYQWTIIKDQLNSTPIPELTITNINDAEHSITISINISTTVGVDYVDEIDVDGRFINQNGTKLKVRSDSAPLGVELILTKL